MFILTFKFPESLVRPFELISLLVLRHSTEALLGTFALAVLQPGRVSRGSHSCVPRSEVLSASLPSL